MYEGSPFDRSAFIFSSSSRPGIMGSPSQVPQLTCVYTRGSGNLTRYHHSSYCSTKRRKPTLGMGITSPHTLFQRKNTNGIFHFKRTDFFVVKMGEKSVFSFDDTDVRGKDKLTLVFRKRSRHWCYIRNAVKIMMIHKKLQFYININW